MNALLKRQIKKFVEDGDSTLGRLQPLLDAISDAYDAFDVDRNLIERSLDVSSEELTEINRKLRQEIRDHKDTEAKLNHAVSLLTATLESTADGILVVDQHGRVESYNHQFKTMWRIPDSIIESGRDEDLLSFVLGQLQDADTFMAKVQMLYATPRGTSSDVVPFKDGRVFERYSQPQVVGEEIVGRVWSFRDVTRRVQADQEQKRLVAELEDANRELEKVNRELGEFAYVVSHDLKAPLRGIKTLADWISTDCADRLNEEGKDQFRLLLNRVDRMHNLIDGILQYSRIGRKKEARVLVDLNRLLPEIIDLLGVPENIEIVVAGPLPILESEPTRLMQVFQNLLSNAIKYMDKPRGRVEVGCEEQENLWTFRVSDNGPGIDSKYFETIFRMFQTLSAHDEFESTGIGLAIVKKIIDSHGGRIWVESEPGRGSTFLFTVPRRQKDIRDAQLQTHSAC